MNAGVDLRMPLLRLRHAEERIDLWKDHGERMRLAQHLEERARRGHLERTLCFLPHALGHERIELAAGRDLSHQCKRFGCNAKSEWRKTCGEACDPQHA